VINQRCEDLDGSSEMVVPLRLSLGSGDFMPYLIVIDRSGGKLLEAIISLQVRRGI
jgi:hypothetical protein